MTSAKAKGDKQTDDGQSDPYVALCFAGVTKIMEECGRSIHKE